MNFSKYGVAAIGLSVLLSGCGGEGTKPQPSKHETVETIAEKTPTNLTVIWPENSAISSRYHPIYQDKIRASFAASEVSKWYKHQGFIVTDVPTSWKLGLYVFEADKQMIPSKDFNNRHRCEYRVRILADVSLTQVGRSKFRSLTEGLAEYRGPVGDPCRFTDAIDQKLITAAMADSAQQLTKNLHKTANNDFRVN